MSYQSLKDCVLDLEKNGHLIRIREEVDPCLEMAEIHRRVYQAGGPAVFFEKVKGSPFPAVSNLFGTEERTAFLFRNTLARMEKAFAIKADPKRFFKNPFSCAGLLPLLFTALPKKTVKAPVLECETTIDRLPQIKSWPDDGGAFILLPQVYTEDPEKPGIMQSNLGMYRVQLSGNDYELNREIGLHYQIRRDIGIHHTRALAKGEPLRVSIFVGGPPAHSFAAVMYLPEKLPETAFAGALGGRRFRYAVRDGFVISADADFCITGFVDPKTVKPEGPFGDHLGYYSLKHPFPFMKVEKVYHRKDAIWPFTVVGRPPQEDSQFGRLVQRIAKPMIPAEIPGVKAVHAVDASGVHPLLLAIGSERYLPYQKRKPMELLAHANALLGYGPLSLAKYLLIVSAEDDPALDVHDIRKYLRHLLERTDWTKDLHFQTATTMDTLDYSGTGINEGSKVVIAAAGEKKRNLLEKLPENETVLKALKGARIVLPGILAVEAGAYTDAKGQQQDFRVLETALKNSSILSGIAWIVLVDDGGFTAESLENFLWVTFTRSNPSHDIDGFGSFTENKHWGCRGPLMIDARIKPHHAPPLVPDASVVRKVDVMAAPGGCLNGIIQKSGKTEELCRTS